jgi:hypothetical protein
MKINHGIESIVIELLRDTNDSLAKIKEKEGLSIEKVRKIQNDAIKQGILDEKYRRLPGGLTKHQRDEIIKLLIYTKYSQTEISKKIGVSQSCVRDIQNKSINKDILDEKYRRISHGIIQYEKEKVKEKVIRLLRDTTYNQSELKKKTGLNVKLIRKIQNDAIKQGILDEKYRRVYGGKSQYQIDENIKLFKNKQYETIILLQNTKDNLSEIGNNIGLDRALTSKIQNDAIKQGILDEKYRRLSGGTIKYQRDEIIELLRDTDDSLAKIKEKGGLSIEKVRKIQNDAIKQGILDEKYRRLHRTIQYQKDDALKLLKENKYTLREIMEKTGLCMGSIEKIKDSAIREGVLEIEYRSRNSLEQQIQIYGGGK